MNRYEVRHFFSFTLIIGERGKIRLHEQFPILPICNVYSLWLVKCIFNEFSSFIFLYLEVPLHFQYIFFDINALVECCGETLVIEYFLSTFINIIEVKVATPL